MIGNGDAVCIVAEITECMVRASEWRFGIDDPILTEQLPNPGGECFGVSQELELPIDPAEYRRLFQETQQEAQRALYDLIQHLQSQTGVRDRPGPAVEPPP